MWFLHRYLPEKKSNSSWVPQQEVTTTSLMQNRLCIFTSLQMEIFCLTLAILMLLSHSNQLWFYCWLARPFYCNRMFRNIPQKSEQKRRLLTSIPKTEPCSTYEPVCFASLTTVNFCLWVTCLYIWSWVPKPVALSMKSKGWVLLLQRFWW